MHTTKIARPIFTNWLAQWCDQDVIKVVTTTLKREFEPLKAIRDNHPQTLLTLDRDPPANFDGIKMINVIDSLLAPKSIEA